MTPPRYPPRAASALGYLKQHYNDVDIYVEDTTCSNMWLALIRPLMPDGRTLTSVNQMGGREAVIAACKASQADTGRRKLFIIDGDFDFLLGLPKPELRHLYRIRAYCIENILICEETARRVGSVSSPTLPEADIHALVDFAGWESGLREALERLFVIYAVARSLDSSVATVGRSVTSLYEASSHGATIRVSAVRKRAFGIYRVLLKCVQATEIRQFLDVVDDRARNLPLAQIVSGKDYILPLFHLRLRRLLGYRGTVAQLLVDLAYSVPASREPYFARRIRAVAQ